MFIFQILKKFAAIILIICLLLDYPIALGSFISDTFGAGENEGLSAGSPWIDSDLPENVTAFSESDPREDYHLYAGKDILLQKKYLEGYSIWNYYSDASSLVSDRAMKLLAEQKQTGHNAELLYDTYDLLIDWDTRNSNGMGEIKRLTDPVLNADSLDELTDYLLTEEALVFLVNFISLSVDISINDSTHYAVYLAPEDLLLDDAAEYSSRTELGDMTAAYNEKMFVYLAGRLGIGESEARDMLEQARDLEEKMSLKLSTAEEMMRDDYIETANNEMSFKELEKLSVNFPLADIVEASGLKYDGKYIVSDQDYLEYLNEIYTDENLEAIKSIVYINALIDLAAYADREAYDFETDTTNECYDSAYWYTDEENAYYTVKELLCEPLQELYVEEYGVDEDRKEMEELCLGVIECYREMLSENEWASQETIDYAIKKLDSIRLCVAYPDKWTDYSDLSVKGCSLLEAIEKITMFYHRMDCARLGGEVDNECWAAETDVLDCNAYYSNSENTIFICLGMMEEPFYYKDMSTEELYASVAGFWVGHEISHCFDSNGARYDAEGNLRDWWSKEDKAEFRRRIDKLDDYLDTIVPFEGYHVNGKSVDTEMLADITGLQCALRMAKKEKDFDYDEFFRKYSVLNLVISNYSSELEELLQDQHPLGYLRTNVVVQQFDEYYETYDVKEGDNMYLAPEDRIKVW